MKQISEQQISAMAPNAAAMNNAKKISRAGGFVSHAHSADDTFYIGKCKGSGSSVYTVSIDFIDEAAPVCRCSCPSRQFPCKHGLALMMELSAGREWEICEIPADIVSKREKKEAREEKKEEKGKDSGIAKAPKKTSKAARTKKLKKQLEGLDMAERMVRELTEAGLGTLGGTSVKVYQDLAKQLGDYYLPGPQRLVQSLVQEIQKLEEGKGACDYKDAVHILVYLRALIRKSRTYLTEKLEQDEVEDDNSALYEELGGIWTLERLNDLGLKKENARLIQLSFDVYYDASRREYVDKGWWVDLDDGTISVTYNYRPVKALKYVKAEDTVFEMAKIPLLTYYPGGSSRRIRWESQEFESVTQDRLQEIKKWAVLPLKDLVKAAKNELKNTLSDGRYACLISFEKIGLLQTGDQENYLLQDQTGAQIELKDRPGDTPSVKRLSQLPKQEMLAGQVMFGVMWYDREAHKICLQPYSIITGQEIMRLVY